MSEGAKEVRILGENEMVMQALRDEINLEPEIRKRLRFYVGDIADNAYMAEAMGGADHVLYVPSLPRAFDCEVAPAECIITFLETVTGVIHTAIDCKVKKLETRNLKLICNAFSEAKNGDLQLQGTDGIERKPCENFEMRR